MGTWRAYIPVYTATLLVSAFLLFAVEPMFGKMILPLLGGTPAVWNTAMVFFQAMLLAGYAYAHLLTRWLKPGRQALLHIALLLFCGLALPVAIPAGWTPPAIDNPALWQLRLMAAAVGGPFFVLAATAPLLQHWFSRSGHPAAGNPYFLYAASNCGSLSALLLYPFMIEPLLTLRQQSVIWAGGYALLALMIGLCGFMVRRAVMAPPETKTTDGESRSAARVGLWLLLSFVPSSLMLGVTTFITTDVASAPLLWILPLAIYVGTFIIAFAARWPFRLNSVLLWQAVFLVAVIGVFIGRDADVSLTLLLHLTLFALTALFCHMQLATLRPGARHLTGFYLIMSCGGVLGGIFNALLAPRLFVTPIEYQLVLALSVFLRYLTDPGQSLQAVRERIQAMPRTILCRNSLMIAAAGLVCAGIIFIPRAETGLAAMVIAGTGLVVISPRRWIFAGLTGLMLLTYAGYNDSHQHVLTARRNFFGVMRVFDAANGLRIFMHGTTMHGAQPRDEALRLMPVSYYSKPGPMGDIFSVMNRRPGPQAIAGLGLGIGSIACWSKPGRHFDFYEIDPDVAAIAQDRSLFTYLSDCGSPYSIIIGDARLKITAAADHSYDMIFVDTFSSDNIPVHLITREAFALYLQKLKPGGLIAINLSNRHLALEPVIAADARDLGLKALFKSKREGLIAGTKIQYAGSIFAVLAPDAATLAPFADYTSWHTWNLSPGQKAWRDDFSNIAGAIRFSKPKPDE